jgi:hypothetical protein
VVAHAKQTDAHEKFELSTCHILGIATHEQMATPEWYTDAVRSSFEESLRDVNDSLQQLDIKLGKAARTPIVLRPPFPYETKSEYKEVMMTTVFDQLDWYLRIPFKALHNAHKTVTNLDKAVMNLVKMLQGHPVENDTA